MHVCVLFIVVVVGLNDQIESMNDHDADTDVGDYYDYCGLLIETKCFDKSDTRMSFFPIDR